MISAFRRLFDLWAQREPGTNPRVLAQRALDAIAGVDLNPFAVAIARFRLIVAALHACGIQRLKDARIVLRRKASIYEGLRPLAVDVRK